jgi:hypothetical protein
MVKKIIQQQPAGRLISLATGYQAKRKVWWDEKLGRNRFGMVKG